MIAMSTTYGPPMLIINPNGSSVESNVREWYKYEGSYVQRRPKPRGLDLILSPTYGYHVRYFVANDYLTYANGLKVPMGYAANPANGTTIPEPYASRERAMAWGKALEMLQNGKFDSATFLGELPETVRWIAGVAKEMVDAYNFVKKGRWVKYLPGRTVHGKRRKRLRIRGPRHRVFSFTRRDGSRYSAKLSADGRLAKRYLEWRFAVTPIVTEVGNLMDAYFDQASDPTILKASGMSVTTIPLEGYLQEGYARVRTYALGYYRMDTSARALQKWGGLNLVHTLWNLVPLSFMVDRFIPIGDFLGNLDAELGVTWLSWTTSQKHHFELRTTVNQYSSAEARYGTSYCRGQCWERKVTKSDHTFPDTISFDKLDFKTGLDLLALARSILVK